MLQPSKVVPVVEPRRPSSLNLAFLQWLCATRGIFPRLRLTTVTRLVAEHYMYDDDDGEPAAPEEETQYSAHGRPVRKRKAEPERGIGAEFSVRGGQLK